MRALHAAACVRGGAAAAATSVHGVAAAGFVAGSSAAYDAGRPEWQLSHARAALALAGVSQRSPVGACAATGRPLFPAAPVLELGAGTGKFTAALVRAVRDVAPAGAAPHVVAVEPSPGFAAAWRVRAAALAAEAEAAGAPAPALTLLSAPASDLRALAPGACSAAFAAQALHWFADAGAGAEIARVLGAGRAFVALWNCRDSTRAQWVREYEAVVHSAYAPGTPSWLSRKWEAWALAFAGFDQPPAIMRWEREAGGHLGGSDTHLAAAMSISEIARRAPDDRARFEARLRAVLAAAPREAGGDSILMPMYTEVLVARIAPAKGS